MRREFVEAGRRGFPGQPFGCTGNGGEEALAGEPTDNKGRGVVRYAFATRGEERWRGAQVISVLSARERLGEEATPEGGGGRNVMLSALTNPMNPMYHGGVLRPPSRGGKGDGFVELKLQKVADWIKDVADAAQGAVDVVLQTGVLKETLEDLCSTAGVAGALFRLAARAVPGPTPEQEIAAGLHRTFLVQLDRELTGGALGVTSDVWHNFMRRDLGRIAEERLNGEFTWLSVFGERGVRPSRSWPVVGELADLARAWVAGLGAQQGRAAPDVQRAADDVRGRVHESLCQRLDGLLATESVKQGIEEARPRVDRDALEALAQELATLDRYRLFGEIPQDAVFIAPHVKVLDLASEGASADWGNVAPRSGGDRAVFEQLLASHRDGHARLVVIQGGMGVGKSCLVRAITSHLARQYLTDKRYAPVYLRWRDVCDGGDLLDSAVTYLDAEYGLPLWNLPGQTNIAYVVDGFDEMRSHEEGYVREQFERLAALARKGCTVLVTMRSAVVTRALQLAWRHMGALVVQVRQFDDNQVDEWAKRWGKHAGAMTITGASLRSLCPDGRDGDVELTHNPLLLYMLAKYVHPLAEARGEPLRRAEIFRVFVDETIRGKLRGSREIFPIDFNESDYRLLLQEIAYQASFPKQRPRCPAHQLRERIRGTAWEQLKFQDVRTAFVLHFFEPGDPGVSEFEFQPEGFREYLLAEWCVRAQVDALLYEQLEPLHALSRGRDSAMDALAQFPLRDEERELLNDIYEALGGGAGDLGWLGVGGEEGKVGELATRLYERVRRQAGAPPQRLWRDEGVGVAPGEEVPRGLDELRLLVNYWDQCIVATLGLYRGLQRRGLEEPLLEDRRALGRFLAARECVCLGSPGPDFKLSGALLGGFDLRGASLRGLRMRDTGLAGADLSGADLSGADLRAANLAEATAASAHMRVADLTRANLTKADLADARLGGAVMAGASLEEANLSRAECRRADFTKASLNKSVLAYADMSEADLSDADLTGADTTQVRLWNARTQGAKITPGQLNVRERL